MEVASVQRDTAIGARTNIADKMSADLSHMSQIEWPLAARNRPPERPKNRAHE
jgi:hypothetical protein